MIWDELKKVALIGTERGKLPEAVERALSHFGIDTEGDPARAVLEGAAIYHQLQRAGFPLPSFEGERTLLPEEEADNRAVASGRAARQLKRILDGRFNQALPEYLRLLIQNQKCIPAEHLPGLFYSSLQSAALWKITHGNLGAVERWLLRQNPDWAPLADRTEVESWPGATHEERLGMLRYVRRTQPEAAASLLKSSWREASYSQKQDFLQEMEHHLGQYDEAFLEDCLYDGRKPVRTAAARLLARLPESALLNRLFLWAQALFQEDKKKGLDLQLVAQLDDDLKRDGIGTSKKTYSKEKRVGWTYEILSQIPPKRWEAHFNHATVDTLRLLAGTNRKKLLLDALANAAVLHQDHRWIEAILRYWWRTNEEESWGGSQGKLLMEHLSGPVFNEIALQHLKQNPGFIEEKSFLYQLLCQSSHPWENALAQLVLKGFQQWLSGARAYYWNLWHYKRILELAAYRIDPGLLETFRTGWDSRSPVWYHWEKDIDRFLRVLAFRAEMRAALR